MSTQGRSRRGFVEQKSKIPKRLIDALLVCYPGRNRSSHFSHLPRSLICGADQLFAMCGSALLLWDRRSTTPISGHAVVSERYSLR